MGLMSILNKAAETSGELMIAQEPQIGAYAYPPMPPIVDHRGRGTGVIFDGSKYPLGISGSRQPMLLDHKALRTNARNAYHESLTAHGMVNRFADTVVWTGLKVEPTPMPEMLGLTPEAAREWSADVGRRFHMWATSKGSTRDETQTLYQLMRLVEIYQQRDNDYFYRFYRNKRRDLQNPLQVQIIDPEQIMSDSMTSTVGPFSLKDGIKRDKAGREVGYTVRVQTADYQYEYIDVPAFTTNGKRIMGHGFFAEYAGQQRGYSLLHPLLQEIQNATDFTLSEIKKAISQSQIWGFVVPSKDKPASAALENFSRNLGQAVTGVGIGGTSDGSTPTAEEVSINPIWEHTITQPGQMFMNSLDGGERLEYPKNTSPSTGFDLFMQEFITNLASARSMPPEVLRMKFGSNYTASRGALMMFWQVVQVWREELIADFLAPIYEAWMDEEIAAGRITAPGWSDPIMKAAWLNAAWHSLPLPHVDPLKEANATKANLEMSLTNQEREARALNGSSAAANTALNEEMFKKTPVAPWVKSAGNPDFKKPGQGKVNPEEEEKEEDE